MADVMQGLAQEAKKNKFSFIGPTLSEDGESQVCPRISYLYHFDVFAPS